MTSTARQTKAGKRTWAWDVEASDPERPWDGATIVHIASEEGDEETFVGPDCLEKTAAHMQKARGTYFAHYGGGYDVPLLLNYWRPKRIVLSGSNILLAEDGPDLKLRDSFPWWLAGLAKVGEAVGEKKFDVDRALMERLTLDEQIAYCKQDVRVLLKGIDASRTFLEDRKAKLAWTAGQSAASLVRALEPGTWKALRRNRCNVDDVMSFLNSGAGRGGKVDCTARGVVENVYVYDIKSSYPARYATQDVGIGLREAKAGDEVGVWRCRWRWLDRRRIPPAVDQSTMCGVGDCEGWLIDDEIKAFESCGVAVERMEGWAPEEILPVGQTFADEMFRAKEGTGPQTFFSKVFLNAWHGKAMMNPLQEQFTSWMPKEYWAPAGEPKRVPEGPRGGWWHRYYTLEHDEDNLLKAYQQPLMGELILGRARVGIWEHDDTMHKAGWPVLYNDTDSLMTTCPPEQMPIPIGNTLGALAFEGGPYTGYFLGPKAYCLTDPSTGHVKKCALKGVPHRSFADGVVDEGIYREARGNERVRGNGPFARKGKGRDVRVQLFEQALSDVGHARALKDGLTTFLRGVSSSDASWKRAPVVRTVRPSGRGKVHLTPTTFEYLATVEVACARLLQSLPDSEERVRARTSQAAIDLASRRAFISCEVNPNVVPRLPREPFERSNGTRATRVDAWAGFTELLAANGVHDYNGKHTDDAYRAYLRGRALDPGTCPFRVFRERLGRQSTWRGALPAVELLRALPDLEHVRVPLGWLTPSQSIMSATRAGEAWLNAMGPTWVPDEDDDDSDDDDDDDRKPRYN